MYPLHVWRYLDGRSPAITIIQLDVLSVPGAQQRSRNRPIFRGSGGVAVADTKPIAFTSPIPQRAIAANSTAQVPRPKAGITRPAIGEARPPKNAPTLGITSCIGW